MQTQSPFKDTVKSFYITLGFKLINCNWIKPLYFSTKSICFLMCPIVYTYSSIPLYSMHTVLCTV